jgi:hypothetical protein
MRHRITCPAAPRRLLALLAAVLLLAACTPSTGATPTATTPGDPLSDVPDEARIATRRGDPRTVAYWAVWNNCAPENRANVAAANGGRAAGWIIMDDLLADPGIQLGDHPVTTCEEGLALLQGRDAGEEEASETIYGLAAGLLAAELNLGAGAETCPIAEEAVLGGHLVLADVGFDGSGEYAAAASQEVADAIPRLVELLATYNSGELCR